MTTLRIGGTQGRDSITITDKPGLPGESDITRKLPGNSSDHRDGEDYSFPQAALISSPQTCYDLYSLEQFLCLELFHPLTVLANS